MENKRYFKEVAPEPVAYYCYGILTRFCAKHSEVLKTDVHGSSQVVAATLQSPRGNLTLYILNESTNEQGATIEISGLDKPRTSYRYRVTDSKVTQTGFGLNPESKMLLSTERFSLKDKLPPLSITVFSTYKLSHSDPGLIAE
ncbi:MAG: hypothetical protein H8E73_10580 [Planctomycetes bacterium]|nr:hypothetical protein [Planctomycetota bacterium]